MPLIDNQEKEFTYLDLPKKDRKVLKYFKKHSGKNKPEDVAKRFGEHSKERIDLLERLGLIAEGAYELHNKKPYSYNYRLTRKGEDFSDAIHGEFLSRIFDRIVIPFGTSLVGGALVWVLTHFFSVQSVVTK